MKKVKMMLLSLALFAVVGGALAFKAKFTDSFCKTNAIQLVGGAYTCIDPANNQVLNCPDPVSPSKIDVNHAAGNVPFCTTTPDDFGDCPNPCLQPPTSLIHD